MSVAGRLLTLGTLLAVAGCGGGTKPESVTLPESRVPSAKTPTKKPNVVLKRGGGFYKDDGPGDEIPDGLDDIPDAEPKWEPIHRPATKPYVVLGKEYVPNATVKPYKARGIASWYGKKFHGQKTSIGEPYDMFAMTAAHTTLAIPSYVRVTNVQTGKSVVVRVTDRGPFHQDRVIDLSYTAAYKLGFINGGSGQVEVEAILPGEPTGTAYAQVSPTVAASRSPATSSAPTPAEQDEIAILAKRLSREEAPVQSAAMAGMAGEQNGQRPGIYLQLGAFANADNAENLRSHLARDLDWVSEPLRIHFSGGIHRLQLGPYASRAEADRVGERIRQTLGGKPTVITR